MKKTWSAFICLPLLAAPAVQAQFTYQTNAGAISITGYTGAGGAVTIPSTITGLPVAIISQYTFADNTNLTSVTIPGSVTDIGQYAFSGCTSLTNVTLPGAITNIQQDTFNGCSQLAGVTIPDSVTSIGDSAFAYTGLTNVTIPNSVTTIGNSAFNTAFLTNVTFPTKSLLQIGADAFAFCSMTSVTIPASVTNLGQNVFIGSFSLKTITVEAGNKYFSSAGGVLFDLKKANLLEYPNGLGGNYTVPSTVTNITYEAFWSCGNVTSVTIPGSVITITSGAFAGCGLTNLTLAKGVTSFGLQAFQGCASLISVTIPASVTNIAPDAFQYCTDLTRIFFEGDAPATDPSAFLDDATNATAYYLPHTTGWSSTLGGIPAVLVPAFLTIKTEAVPAAADAIVTSTGLYGQGLNATFAASTPEACFYFVGWTVGSKTVSTANSYTFTVTNDETLTANFAQFEYTITTTSSPTNWGSTSGGGKKACGTTATISAHPAPGFGFVHWTDDILGTGDVPVSTNPGYKFTVTGNETLTAVFADTERPTVKITSPTTGEKIGTSAFIIQGSASDNVGVQAVYYNLNGTGWTLASTADNFTSWSAHVTLTPNSVNTVSAYSVDTSENFSTTNTPVKFTCTAAGLAPLSIAGQLAEAVSATNDNDFFMVSLGSAAYVLLDSNTNGRGEVGTYTYTPTGLNTGELAPRRVLPTPGNATNGSVLELTFTDAYTAGYTNLSGGAGTFYFAAETAFAPANFAPEPPSVLMTFVEETSSVNTNYMANHAFSGSTFTTTDSLGGSNSGTYTYTRFTPVSALVVETYTAPPAMIGTTNYLILWYTNNPSSARFPVTGAYFSENVAALGEVGSDVGSFSEYTGGLVSGVLPAVPPLQYVGPATLSGLQATVTPKGEPSFIRSYGDGTFASTSLVTNEPTDVGILLADTRVSTNTGVSTFLALDPPYAVGHDDYTVDVTWKSASSATVTVLGTNETAALSFSTAGNYAPPALSGHRITATPTQKGQTSILTFTNNFFNITGGLTNSGTYTYAPYTRTMALVQATSALAATAGQVDYVLLNYQSLNSGTYVLSQPDPNSAGNWTFKTGVFSTK